MGNEGAAARQSGSEAGMRENPDAPGYASWGVRRGLFPYSFFWFMLETRREMAFLSLASSSSLLRPGHRLEDRLYSSGV